MYKHKPTTAEAIHYDGTEKGRKECIEFADRMLGRGQASVSGETEIRLRNDPWRLVRPGNWIVYDGRLFSMTDNDFRGMYEEE